VTTDRTYIAGVMRLPSLFRKESELTAQAAQDRAEKLLVESFRLLSQLCSKVADMVEAQRLSRAGFEEQDKFLERMDRKK
jgi:hypothetical protein